MSRCPTENLSRAFSSKSELALTRTCITRLLLPQPQIGRATHLLMILAAAKPDWTNHILIDALKSVNM